MEQLTKMSQSDLMLDIAMSFHKNHFLKNKSTIRENKKAEIIISEVIEYYQVKRYDLKSSSRVRTIVEPRNVCIYLLRHNTLLSLKAIGGIFGGRDHSTVLHSIASVNTLKEVYPDFENKFKEVELKVLKKLK